MGGLGTFALGVGAALAVQAFGPALGRWARPVARAALKQGIILSEGAQVRAAGLREDMEDLVEEAREAARREMRTGPQAVPAQTDAASQPATPRPASA